MRIPCLLAALVALLLPASLRADDWPQWRGPTRTGHVPADVVVPSALPEQPEIVWRRKIGDGLASPVVAGGKVFYLDNQAGKETVHAVAATTGDPLWQTELDKAFKDSQSTAGPRATPVVDGDRLYAQSCRGELKCLSTADGHTIWNTNYATDFGAIFTGEQGKAAGASRHGYNGAPVVHGNLLIALVGSTNGAGIVAFDKRTGAVQWRSTSETAAYASPIVARVAGREQVIAFMTDALVGVDAREGTLLWRVPLKTTFGRHVTTPTVLADQIFVASHEFGLVAVNLTNAGWGMIAQTAWTNKEAGFNFASPIVVGKNLYGLGPRKNMVCVNPVDGSIAWSQDDLVRTSADKAHASFVGMKDKILVLTDSGELRLVAADPAQFREVGRAQVCAANWCSPAYADGKLYLRDARELVCVRLVP